MISNTESWVVYFTGLVQPVSVKVVRAESDVHAMRLVESRLKSGQTAIKAERFTSWEDISILAEKRRARQAEIQVKIDQRQAAAQAEWQRIQNDVESWPGKYIPHDHVSYMISILYTIF
jgi:hypothetical protein